MAEQYPLEGGSIHEIPYFLREDLAAQYEDTSLNYLLRWELYKQAVPLIDFHYEAARMADLSDNERVLDVGTGSGAFLLDYLYDKLGHRGQMVGVDYFERQFEVTNLRIEKMRESGENLENIELIKGDMVNLQLEEDSFDTAFALFSIYHASDPLKALQEIKKVVRPGGKVVIATSGKLNKLMHRRFEEKIATWMTQNIVDVVKQLPDLKEFLPPNPEYWRFSPPTVMSTRFNTETAEKLLPQMFRLHKQYPPAQLEGDSFVPFQTLHITPQNKGDYFNSLWSMQNQFEPKPPPGLYNAAMQAVVAPELEESFQRTGEFKDYVFRSIHLCINEK